MYFGTVRSLTTDPTASPSLENAPMNLRDVQFSSRFVIPVALALPINREPADIHGQTEGTRRRRDPASDEPDQDRRSVSFYL
jgi:hypothetical protein